MIELMTHQAECSKFWAAHKRILNHGDTGTGKTISALDGYVKSVAGRLLVIAPLSILRPAWGADIDKFLPNFSWAVAHGSTKKRMEAFRSGADIVLINHDGVKWIRDQLLEDEHFLGSFSHCVVDEYTAYKNRSSQRSKAMRFIAENVEYLQLLSGTPNSNKITDLWYPVYLVDKGQRLGDNFYRFQNETCSGKPVPGAPRATIWEEKAGSRDVVGNLLRDITIRHTLQECVDIPENTRRTMSVDMPASVMAAYRQLERDAYLAMEDGVITAVHAGARTKKILQLLSGAVYDEEGEVVKIHPHRYELVIDLVAEREHSVVAFNWRHERQQLCQLADARKIKYGIIDGSVSANARNEVVNAYQNGELQVIFAHPQSAGHGLTLTRGTSTIWASPTYNAEHYVQFNARIYRKGQDKKTETICIAASNTKEEEVYEKLAGKCERMSDLLGIFAQNTRLGVAA